MLGVPSQTLALHVTHVVDGSRNLGSTSMGHASTQWHSIDRSIDRSAISLPCDLPTKCFLGTNDQPKTVVDVVAFWHGSDTGGEPILQFNPGAPSVAAMDCSLDEKAKHAVSMVVEKVLLPAIRAGRARSAYVQELAGAIADALTTRAEDLPEGAEHACKRLLAMAMAIRLLRDPSPLAMQECTNMKDVRQLLGGDFQDHPWDVVADAFDDDDSGGYWSSLKTDWKKHRAWQLEHAPTVRKLLAEIQASPPSLKDLLAIGNQMVPLLEGCRPGGLLDLESAVCVSYDELLKTIEEDRLGDAVIGHDDFRAAVGQLLQLKAVMFKNSGDKQAMPRLHKRGLDILTKMTRDQNASSVLAGLSAYVQQNSIENWVAIRSSYSSVTCKLSYNDPKHAAIIKDGMHSLARHALAVFEETGDMTEERVAKVKEMVVMMTCLFGMIAEPCENAVQLKGWAERAIAMLAIVECCTAFVLLGETCAQRVEHEDSYDAWSKLKAVVQELPRTSAGRSAEELAVEPWPSLERVMKPHITKAACLTKEYMNAVIKDAMGDCRKDLDALIHISGGMATTGASWKVGIDGDASWDDLAKHANRTIFAGGPQRGLPKKIKTAKLTLKETLKATRATIRSVTDEPLQAYDELAEEARKVLANAAITIIEACLMQAMTSKSTATKQSEVQTEIDRVQDEADLSFDMLHPALYAKALAVLREG